MKKENIVTTVLIITIIALVAGISFAWYIWTSEKFNNTGGSECFDILYVKGQDIGSDQNRAVLMPSDTYSGGLSSTVKINMKNTCTTINARGKIYLNTLDTTSSNLYREGLLNYQVLKNGTETSIRGSILSSGEIELDIGLLSKKSVATDSYTIYIWIDNNLVENADANSVYYGNIRAEAYQIEE